MRHLVILAGLALLTGACILLSLITGSTDTGWSSLLSVFNDDALLLETQVITELRWPRTAAAFVTGALLAVAGGLMQVLLRNPLADPYVLGVSGGAAVAALLAMMLGLGSGWLQGAAFSGALFSMLLVFGLAHGRGSWSGNRLLLTGVVVAAGWGALISFLLAVSPAQELRGMLFWLMGDLSYARLPVYESGVLLAGLLASVSIGRALNILTHGELSAASLGIRVKPLRQLVFLLASLLTATAVTLAGSIGFVGLIVPHMLRLLGVRDHRVLLPAAALLGGCLLVIADTLARTLIAPGQLPAGTLTALVGVPVFLVLLHHGRSLYTEHS